MRPKHSHEATRRQCEANRQHASYAYVELRFQASGTYLPGATGCAAQGATGCAKNRPHETAIHRVLHGTSTGFPGTKNGTRAERAVRPYKARREPTECPEARFGREGAQRAAQSRSASDENTTPRAMGRSGARRAPDKCRASATATTELRGMATVRTVPTRPVEAPPGTLEQVVRSGNEGRGAADVDIEQTRQLGRMRNRGRGTCRRGRRQRRRGGRGAGARGAGRGDRCNDRTRNRLHIQSAGEGRTGALGQHGQGRRSVTTAIG